MAIYAICVSKFAYLMPYVFDKAAIFIRIIILHAELNHKLKCLTLSDLAEVANARPRAMRSPNGVELMGRGRFSG
jgi:hypothetical protein